MLSWKLALRFAQPKLVVWYGHMTLECFMETADGLHGVLLMCTMLTHYRVALMAASTFSMSSVGSKRLTTFPSRVTRNLVKFHLMLGFEA